jgi:hypothetical protein
MSFFPARWTERSGAHLFRSRSAACTLGAGGVPLMIGMAE